MNQVHEENTAPINSNMGGVATVLITLYIIMLLWVFAGIAAFIMSIICFRRSGSLIQHVIGLIIAIIFGPFYWLYFWLAKSYCRKY